ncbi:SLAM family member 7 isoform X2 [Octodon degus]|uniref:SLAM family member 7 isoform X2 n=1 Tax=Octodon degus TaxID=10160 RepID=A0A6P6D7J2_OCTDE|nr:SLAM family member 7 isoform X2 [Octodon degus]
MAAPPAQLILISLLCQLTVLAASEAIQELIGAVGGSVTFSVNFTVQQVDSIDWTFNKTRLVTVEPATGDKQATFIAAQKRNKPRIAFQDGGYSLTFSQLKKSDSGIYSVEVHRPDSQEDLIQKYRLHVYEFLSKPRVTTSLQSHKNGTCITNLTCSVEEGGEDVTYSWKALDQAANESYDGSILPISWTLGGHNTTFICMARNPVSSNSSSPILAQMLCREPIKSKRELDTHQEVPSFYPNSAENTEYDTIPHIQKSYPGEDAANSLYSTVQIPKKVQVEKPHLPDTPKQFGYENII